MARARPRVLRERPTSGGLKLLTLEKQFHYDCVRCGAGRTAAQVALEGYDWARTVCIPCYDRAAAAAMAAKRERPKKDPLMRHVRPLATFFIDAGVPVALEGEWVKVARKRSFKGIGLSRLLGKRDWDDLIDRVAFADCPDVLIDAMRRNAGYLGFGVRAFFVRDASRFNLLRGEELIGWISPTRVQILGESRIHGNFLTNGDHWKKVREAVMRRDERRARDEAAAQVEQEPAAKAHRWLTAAPEGVVPDVVTECLAASADIRLRRSVAYSHVVELRSAGTIVSFSPISAALVVPFEVRHADRRLTGLLRLAGTADPLPVRVPEDAEPALVATAWAAALLGFAAATCFTVDAPPEPRAAPTAAPRKTNPGGTAIQTESRTLAARRRRFWPRQLEPTGSWAARGPSSVPGHRRRLTGGRVASAEARARARAVGIALAEHETWVQPHTRGIADDEHLTFRWTPSVPLVGTTTSVSGSTRAPERRIAVER